VTYSARIVPLGDSAFLVSLGTGVDIELSARIARLANELRGRDVPGRIAVVPAYAALAVHFDPAVADTGALTDLLRRLVTAEVKQPAPDVGKSGKGHVIPVRYDGPDLDTVAQRLRLPSAEVIRRHAERTYQVLFLGFVPGFGYLGPLDPMLALPRRPEPRQRIPPGSVAIAGEQTAIYPVETPGGWHLIGRTDTVLFDPSRSVPNLLAAGDRVRFKPVQ